MQLGSSVRKRNPAEEGGGGGDGLRFAPVRDAAAEFLQRRAGKAVVLAEGSSFSAMLPAAQTPKALSLLWEGDALPLFALPNAACILAAGGEAVLQAARFFAAVQGIPCMLFPVNAALDGAFCPRGGVTVGGNTLSVPLAAAEAVCDMRLLRASLAEGYARLLLARLARFEERALGLLCRRPFGGAVYEEGYALSVFDALPPEEIVRRNARLRVLEGAGLPQGEGRAAEGSPYAVWRALTALYAAFFGRGVPRRYLVPDYAARAARAGVPYAGLNIPSEKEYAARAMRLERVRGELLREIGGIAARRHIHARSMRTLAPQTFLQDTPDFSLLKTLPERAEGLCAVIRDFGLMEEI